MTYNHQSLIEIVRHMVEFGDEISLLSVTAMWRMWYPALRCPRDSQWVEVFGLLGLEASN